MHSIAQAPNSPPYRLLGGPGSPYSLKMRAVLRYRRIPHVWIVPNGYLGSCGELQQAGKRMIPVLQFPDGHYGADSTPLCFELERLHRGKRTILPPDPQRAFLAHLIEDMADELLVVVMFDLRWRSNADREFCARRQLSGWMSPLSADVFERRVAAFIKRQTMNRVKWVQGDNPAILADLYSQVLDSLEHMLEVSPFLFGSRPSLADFGLFGQLSQCAIDPSASAIMRSRAPRTYQWTQTMDDCSGVEGTWLPVDADHAAVRSLLTMAGRFHLPIMHGHARAALAGADTVSVQVDGCHWKAETDPYKRNCLVWLRRELAAMSRSDRSELKPLLEETGCWHALQPDGIDQYPVPEMAPI